MEIASIEDICKIMSMGVDKNDRVIITLLLSSGLPSKFIEEMTYDQLLDACNHFFRYDETRSIQKLVTKNPKKDKLVPCFDFKYRSRQGMTCCTPQALQLLIEYLRYRIKIDDGTDYVLLNYKNEPIADCDHISNLFRRARKKASRYLLEGSLDIKADNVRERFKDICKNDLQGEYRDEVLALMDVKGSSNKKFYEYIKDNRHILLEHYVSVVDSLTLNCDDIIHRNR